MTSNLRQRHKVATTTPKQLSQPLIPLSKAAQTDELWSYLKQVAHTNRVLDTLFIPEQEFWDFWREYTASKHSRKCELYTARKTEFESLRALFDKICILAKGRTV